MKNEQLGNVSLHSTSLNFKKNKHFEFSIPFKESNHRQNKIRWEKN